MSLSDVCAAGSRHNTQRACFLHSCVNLVSLLQQSDEFLKCSDTIARFEIYKIQKIFSFIDFAIILISSFRNERLTQIGASLLTASRETPTTQYLNFYQQCIPHSAKRTPKPLCY